MKKGTQHTEETRKKMSVARIGKPPSNKGKNHSAEARKKMSLALKGRVAWNKGLSKETDPRIRAQAEKHIGWQHSTETRKKMSVAKTGKHYPKISEARKGKHTWNKGQFKIGKAPAWPKLRYVEDLHHNVRSTWEEAVCKHLQDNNIEYTYETHRLYSSDHTTSKQGQTIITQHSSIRKLHTLPHTYDKEITGQAG